jgi:hypothetical protein
LWCAQAAAQRDFPAGKSNKFIGPALCGFGSSESALRCIKGVIAALRQPDEYTDEA